MIEEALEKVHWLVRVGSVFCYVSESWAVGGAVYWSSGGGEGVWLVFSVGDGWEWVWLDALAVLLLLLMMTVTGR